MTSLSTPPSNPCYNEGVCNLTDTGYKCTCLGSFSGTNCEISPCSPNPCENSGTCKLNETVGTSSCDCAVGDDKWQWTGSTCASRKCIQNDCKNGGSCHVGESYTSLFDGNTSNSTQIVTYCNCIIPYHGVNCESIE